MPPDNGLEEEKILQPQLPNVSVSPREKIGNVVVI